METLKKFEQFVDEITAENGRNYKISVLERYKDDLDIEWYLFYLLNPYIATGISDKKLARFHSDSCIDTYPANQFKTTKDALSYLAEHNTGDSNTVELMFSYYMYLYTMDLKSLLDHAESTDLHSLFEKLISKNLPLGIDAKTVNKVSPGLIPTFNVQLANKYFDNPAIVEGKEFTLTTKIDGGRIIAIKKNGEAKFYTRQGQEYEGLVDLRAEMEAYMPDDICLDGEITLLDSDGLVSKDQYKQTMKITRADGEKHGVKMIVFDIMTAQEFEAQRCDTPYKDRKAKLTYMFNGLTNHTYKYFTKITEWYTGKDTSVIPMMLTEAISNGEEGLMINIDDAPYNFKRTNNLLKVKKMQDVDLEIIGFEEGDNRHKGRLGAALCDYKGNILKVGSGFSDELRNEIWAHQDEWLGRTITVQYFEETTNADGGVSLRFPVYVDYRTDK